MKISKKFVSITGAVVVAGAGSITAFAAWTASGGGNASAATITATAIAVNGLNGTPDLYPGANGKVYFKLSNPNPYAVTVTNVKVGTPIAANTTACPSSNLIVTAPAGGVTVSVPLAAHAFAVETSIDGVQMAHSAPDGCQGMAFIVTLTVTGDQQ